MSKKDVGCLRAHNIAKWSRDIEYATLTGDDTVVKLCWGKVDMKREAAVNALSNEMASTYGCNLNLVTSSAISPYIDLPEDTANNKAFKIRVLDTIAAAIKTRRNPVNGIMLDRNGVTEFVVRNIIRFCRSGTKVAYQAQVSATLTKAEIGLLDDVFKLATEYYMEGDEFNEASTVIKIQRKIINQRVRDTLTGRK
jgi:hypothetical protein